MKQPTTRYAKSGDVHIAYQVVGEGSVDLVYTPGAWSNVDVFWEEPSVSRFLRRLATFCRLIVLDKRGTGLSDRVARLPTLEQRMDDVRAVMDAVGSDRAALLGASEGGPMSALFAATYPDRTAALVLYGSFPRWCKTEDYPWGPTREELDVVIDGVEEKWGEAALIDLFAPTADDTFKEWYRRLERFGASPSAGPEILRAAADVDIRHLLPSIRVPALVVHRTGDLVAPVEGARYMAKQIPGSKYVEVPGNDHFVTVGNQEYVLEAIEEFLTGNKRDVASDRVLATVLFTDIADSTEKVASLGDRRWRELLEQHHDLVRRELRRHRGQEVDTAGDGFLATFDGPARAVECAIAVRDALRHLGIEIRAGLHTGECEVIAGKVGGLAVHIGARVAASAGPGEVLASSTVKDLTVGSGIKFVDRGPHELKGIPEPWRLFVAEGHSI